MMPIINERLQTSKWGHHWDLSLDYPTLLDNVKGNIERLRSAQAWKELAYNAMILTQLSNESRVSEAQEAVLKWATGSSDREVRVRTRKRFDQEERLIIIPSAMLEEDRATISQFKDDFTRMILVKGKEALYCSPLRQYARRAYGINTHSLRYAGITDLGVRQKVSPLVIGKITKHKNLNQLLTYLQEKEGIEELRKQVANV